MTPPPIVFAGMGPGARGWVTPAVAAQLVGADCIYCDDASAELVAEVVLEADHPVAVETIGADAADNARRILQAAREGARVVRACVGDGTSFRPVDAEIEALLRAKVPFVVLPGVGWESALCAATGITLTKSSDASPSFAMLEVTEGHLGLFDWAKLATSTDTLIVRTAGSVMGDLVAALMGEGRSPEAPAAYVRDLGRPTQVVERGPLRTMASRGAKVGGVGFFVLGPTVGRSPSFDAFTTRPLFGRRILTTRSLEQSRVWAEKLERAGAVPVVVPLLEFQAPADPVALRAALDAMADYDWVLFSSANGVRSTFENLSAMGRDARAFGRSRVGVVGPETASELATRGIRADRVADDFRGEGLAKVLLAEAEGARALLLRAEVAPDVLPNTLREAGWTVDIVPAYRTAQPAGAAERLRTLLEVRKVDAVTFTSSSSVDNFCDALGDDAPSLLSNAAVACIGPVTAQRSIERGLAVDVVAPQSTTTGLLQALERHFFANFAK
jgi:uroporphyrinogen III methyltransferase/synthase